MGLDLTYGLTFKTNEEKENFEDTLKASFTNHEDFSSYNDSISVYYRLNWAGVRYEENSFSIPFLEKNVKPSKKIKEGNTYIYINENKLNFIKIDKNTDLNTISDKILYNLDKANKTIEKENLFGLSPISVLTLDQWKGSNGESFLLVKTEDEVILYNNEEDYDEELDEYISKDIQEKEILIRLPKKEFMDKLSNSLQFIKSILDDSEINYIDIKSREIMFILKYFMYNDVELYVYMG